MRKLPTIEDVARRASVSRQTVSNVLNSPQIVRPGTRDRVQTAIAELGYRPDASARRLRTQRSNTIGIGMAPATRGVSGSVLDAFLHSFTAQADTHGLRVMLFAAVTPEAELEQIQRLRDGADVDAFMLTETHHGDPRTGWLIDNAVPFVTFGRPWGIDDLTDPAHPWVDVDGWAGVYQATMHLADTGATRIGYLGWPQLSGTGDDRRRGWRDAMRERFNSTDAELEALSIDSLDPTAAAQEAALALLARSPHPDAIVCASDSLAFGALMAAASVGHIDFPVIGFDNSPVAEALGLSSVDQCVDEVAGAALELLLDDRGVLSSARPGVDTRHRLITPRLVVREHTQLVRHRPIQPAPVARHEEKETQ